MDYVHALIKYVRYMYDVIYKDKRITILQETPSAELLKNLMDKGYVFVATVDYGSTRHNIVLYGYNDKNKQFYFFDQLTMNEIRVKYNEITDFLRTVYGYGLIGYRKKFVGEEFIKLATQEMEKHIEEVKKLF